MQEKARNTNARGIGLLPLLLLLMGAAGNAPALTRNCDGYSVSDSTVLSPALQRQLDTIPNVKLARIYLSLWVIDLGNIPDSCHNVFCPEDTLSTHYYKIWSQKLFTDYELYRSNDTLHTLTPTEAGLSSGYGNLLARKSTILALVNECYIKAVGDDAPPVSTKPWPIQEVLTNEGRTRFDALGRTPVSRPSPMKPMATPTFAPR